MMSGNLSGRKNRAGQEMESNRQNYPNWREGLPILGEGLNLPLHRLSSIL